MFAQLYDFCSSVFSMIINFFNDFYDMLSTVYDFGALGSFTLLDVIFVGFLATLVARIVLVVVHA